MTAKEQQKPPKPRVRAKVQPEQKRLSPRVGRASDKRQRGRPGSYTVDFGAELPPSWQRVLADEVGKPYFRELQKFVAKERRKKALVFPPPHELFSAFELTPFEKVNVLLLGQDPYHDDEQAHGLCFSVRPGIRPPPSLVNMFAELEADMGFRRPNHGCLEVWAKQGVLMLNAILTVRAHNPYSHKGRGWEVFTDAVIQKVNEKRDRVVFVLWGGHAQKKRILIDTSRHVVLMSAHPSPLSARNGFFGSRPFSHINRALQVVGKDPIRWKLQDIEGLPPSELNSQDGRKPKRKK